MKKKKIEIIKEKEINIWERGRELENELILFGKLLRSNEWYMLRLQAEYLGYDWYTKWGLRYEL